MLVLSRKRNEAIVINDDIQVVVVEIRGDKVRLGVDAPNEVPVHRREVHDAILRQGGSTRWPVKTNPAPQLAWHNDVRSENLLADSAFHDGGVPLVYCVGREGAEWAAYFESAQLGSGDLLKCLRACQEDYERTLAQVKPEPGKAGEA